MDKNRLETISFAAVFVGILILVFLVFQPFFHILVLAAILSVLLQPLYKKMIGKNGKGKSAIAFLLVLSTLIFIIVPLLILGFKIFQDSQGLFAALGDTNSPYLDALQRNIDIPIHHIFPAFSIDVRLLISKFVGFVSDNLGVLISQTAFIMFQIFFLLFAFFFFLRDGESILETVISFSPFEKEHTNAVFVATQETVNSVIKGTLFVGIIRWVLVTGGLYIFGVPHALLWGSIGGIVSAIPGLGTPFAIVPAVIFLIFQGSTLEAVLLGLFGIVIVILVDNLLTTYFFGKGLDVSPIFILFSILGGLIYFGPLGFIFGPIVLSLFVSVLTMYKILVLKKQS